MISPSKQPIIIVGAGIAGCFLALLLAKKGYKVKVIEKFSQKEMINNNSKRTFNITIYGYGLGILKKAGLWKTLQTHVLPLKGSVTQVNNKSKPIFAPLDTKKTPYFAIQRASLIRILVNEARSNKNITFLFGSTLLSANTKNKTIRIKQGSITKIMTYEVLFGADGVNSRVRSILQKTPHAYHSQEYSNWAYKQIEFTKESVEKIHLDTSLAYTWSRKHAVLATFPNKDKSITAILILPKNRWATLTTDSQIKNLIKRSFTGLMPILPNITTSLLKNPLGNFVTVHTSPWHTNNSIAILGDAAHGFYPFFGQGISAALGDCMTISNLMAMHNSWEEVFHVYESKRKIHMDAMGELSKQGFELYKRHRKADYSTIYNKFEDVLNSLFPAIIQPSIFQSIVKDPEHTADYVKKHTQQRLIARYIGVPLVIGGTTAIVRFAEEVKNIFVSAKYYQSLI